MRVSEMVSKVQTKQKLVERGIPADVVDKLVDELGLTSRTPEPPS